MRKSCLINFRLFSLYRLSFKSSVISMLEHVEQLEQPIIGVVICCHITKYVYTALCKVMIMCNVVM